MGTSHHRKKTNQKTSHRHRRERVFFLNLTYVIITSTKFDPAVVIICSAPSVRQIGGEAEDRVCILISIIERLVKRSRMYRSLAADGGCGGSCSSSSSRSMRRGGAVSAAGMVMEIRQECFAVVKGKIKDILGSAYNCNNCVTNCH